MENGKLRTSFILFLILALSLHTCMGLSFTRVDKKRLVELKVQFQVESGEKYSVRWMDRRGKRLEEVNPDQEPSGTNLVTSVRIYEEDGPATVYISTGMEWIRATIRGDIKDESQSPITVPTLQVEGNLVYGASFESQNIKVTHPKLDYVDPVKPYQSQPLFIDVYHYDDSDEKVTRTNIADSGYLWDQSLGSVNDELAKTQINLVSPRKGVLVLTYTSEVAPEDVVQLIQVGRSVAFYNSSESGPFSRDIMDVGHPFLDSSIKCSGVERCEVSCVAVSGRDIFNATISKDGQDLVSASKIRPDPLAQIGFPPIPDQGQTSTTFKCDFRKWDRSVRDVRDITVQFNISPKILEAQSKVVATSTGYEASCFVKTYPGGVNGILTFMFEDSSLNQAVEVVMSYPFWNIQKMYGKLDVVSGGFTGVECKVPSKFGYQVYFIPYNV